MPRQKGRTPLIEARIEEIVGMLLERPEIMTNARSKFSEVVAKKYQVSIRMAKNYIAWAYEGLEGFHAGEKEKNLRRALNDRQSIIYRARKNKDLRAELQALKDRDSLLGLYIEKHELAGPDGGDIPVQTKVFIERKIVHAAHSPAGDLSQQPE